MGPIRGKARPVNAKTIDINTSIHNRFDIVISDAETGEVKQRAVAHNIILNSLWSYLNYGWFNAIHYGSGTGTPAKTDTQLFTFVAGITATDCGYTNDSTKHVFAMKKKIVLQAANAVGVTITEIGIGRDNDLTTLVTHAMLKDANGNAISIAKTSSDILTIYATVFCDYSALVAGLGEDINNYLWLLHTATGVGAISQSDGFSQNTAYLRGGSSTRSVPLGGVSTDAVNKTITVHTGQLAAAAGNGNGIWAYELQSWYTEWKTVVMFPFSSSLYPGCDVVGEAIGTGNGSKVDFGTYFTDVSNAVIYVDGVAATGVTVDNTTSVTNNIHFSSPPATGSVITGNYHTAIVAKDKNSLFDFSLVFHFGEPTS